MSPSTELPTVPWFDIAEHERPNDATPRSDAPRSGAPGSDMPRYSARELRAAAAALAAGRFSSTPRTRVRPETGHASPGADMAPTTSSIGSAPMVRVRAGNAGAGASTVALALADAADRAGVRTRVLDAAAPGWCGLVGAPTTELGAAGGWRRGRRGEAVLIDRVDQPVSNPTEVPDPRHVHGVDLTVLDAGWSMRELASAQGAWVATAPAQVEVVVTRSHERALSQTEGALAHLHDHIAADRVLVVVVGPRRSNDRAIATAGPRLRTAHQLETVVFAPVLSEKALPGLGPGPLPKHLTTVAQQLLELITSIAGPLATDAT